MGDTVLKKNNTNLITEKINIDAILESPYTDAVPTAFSELVFATHSTDFGYDENTIIRTGEKVLYGLPIQVRIDGMTVCPDHGIYCPSHTRLFSDLDGLEVREYKFITLDDVVTSCIRITNKSEKAITTSVAVNKPDMTFLNESRDVFASIVCDGFVEKGGVLEKNETVESGETAEFICMLVFADNEESAAKKAKDVLADEERLATHCKEYLDWFKENIPFFECSDELITRIYYFRWLTYRNNIRRLPGKRYMVSEFLPNVSWAGAHNSIIAPISHHLCEGRWIKNRKYLLDYMAFWFETDGVQITQYVAPMANAYYSEYLVSGDRENAVRWLDRLIEVYEIWEKSGAPRSGYYDKENGLYFVNNGHDGMEYSMAYHISEGKAGYRTTVNSYMYADALAISDIAVLAGKSDVAELYRKKAEYLKKNIEDKLWDENDRIFESFDATTGKPVGAKELNGYIPWCYGLPEDNRVYATAWHYLDDPQTFYGEFGPATSDKSHELYSAYDKDSSLKRMGECNWDGSSWPFATSQTLVALANLLNDYTEHDIGADTYWRTLKAYANGQHKNGYPWIGENLDADTGLWYVDRATRSYHYNHSSFADLIISGLVGIRAEDNDKSLTVNPLVPDGALEYFALENLSYRGKNITVVYDKSGEVYGSGSGLTVFVDGEIAMHSQSLTRLSVCLG